MDLKLVAEGLQFPEGPVAMADGSVILVEMRRGTLSRVTAEGHGAVRSPNSARVPMAPPSARTAQPTSATTAMRGPGRTAN